METKENQTNENKVKPNNDWKDREIGALWKREGTNQKYLTGKINVDGTEKKVVVFSNKHKNKDSHPDFRIYLSKDAETTSTSPNWTGNEELL